ncbi:hybrid sensor histidine kinase/response regulator, partial [Bosea sp. CER48]
SGGPPVTPPSRQGFGSILIDRSVPFDLGGRSELSFEPDGVVARLCIPARFVRWVDGASPLPEASEPAKGKPGRPLEGMRVLLVEDQFIIAMDCEDMLLQLGAKQVEVCASVAEAQARLDLAMPELAILDVNLGAETSEPVSRRLREAGVPFVLATGYDDLAILGVADAATLRKPYNLTSLDGALRKLLGAG